MPGERNTVQKELVLQTISAMHSHPTAEAVHDQIAQSYPSVSKATVYRNLNTLAENGKICRVAMPDGADCYDHRTDGHYHIRCISCRKVYDAQFPFMPELTERAGKEEPGFLLTGHTLIFEGICPDCRGSDGFSDMRDEQEIKKEQQSNTKGEKTNG